MTVDYVSVKCVACGTFFTSDNGGEDCTCPVCGRNFDASDNTKYSMPIDAGRLMYAADSALYAQKFDEARALYKKAVKADKFNPFSHFGLALCKHRVAFTKLDIGGGKVKAQVKSLNRKNNIDRNGEFKKAVALADITIVKAFQAVRRALCGIESSSEKDDGDNSRLIYDKKEFSIEDNNLILYKGDGGHVVVPDGVKVIESGAFCSDAIESVFIPASVKTIENKAFFILSNLKDVIVDPDNKFYKSVGGCLIDAVNRVLVYGVGRSIPAGEVEEIAPFAFMSSDIERIKIPDGVKVIGEDAFGGCDCLKRVEIPATLISVHQTAFSHCSAIDELIVAEDNPVYCVKDGCLYETHTDTVVFGTSNASIPTAAQTIGAHAFNGIDIERVYIPAAVTDIEDGAFSCCYELVEIEVDTDNRNYIGVGNCIIERESGVLIAGCGKSEIPTDGSVTEIAESAFESSSLEAVVIPRGVTEIGVDAFYGCDSLESAKFDDLVGWAIDGIEDIEYLEPDTLRDERKAAEILLRGDRLFKN